MTDIGDMAIAAHQLGHAFVARETGLKPGRLVIHEWTGYGWCWVGDNQVLSDQEAVWACVQVCVAGELAERRFRQESDLSAPWGYGSQDDLDYANELLGYLEQDWTLTMARDLAEVILDQVWPELEPLIRELADNGSLSAA